MLNIYVYKGKNGTMQKYQDFTFDEKDTVGDITGVICSNGFNEFTTFDVLNAILKLQKSGDEGFAEFEKQNGDEIAGLQLSFS